PPHTSHDREGRARRTIAPAGIATRCAAPSPVPTTTPGRAIAPFRERHASERIRRSCVQIAVAPPDASHLLTSDDSRIHARRNARQPVTDGHAASAKSHPRLIY